MTCARPHTDQVQHDGETPSTETPSTVAQKLRAIGYCEPVLPRTTPAEARARALIAASVTERTCRDCPCDGVGAVTAAVLLVVGSIVGVGVTLITIWATT